MSDRNNRANIPLKRAPNLVLILGALAQLHVDFVGQVFLSELLLYAFWATKKNRQWYEKELFKNSPNFSIFQKFLVLALASQVLTDILRGSYYVEVAKGTALILFTIFNLRIIYVLSINYWGVVDKMLLGYGLSFFVGALLQPNQFFMSYPWKFGFAYGSTLLFLIFLKKYLYQYKIFTLLLIIFFAGVNLALDTRSLGLIIFAAGIINLTSQVFRRSRFNAVLSLILILLIVPYLYAIYVSDVRKGAFGLKAQQKYLFQQENTNNLLYGGRTDFFVGLSQVKKSPFFGKGSYAKITSSNRQEIFLEITKRNPNYRSLGFIFYEGRMIPTHSILIQFWVWYGILGALPWAWFLYLIARTICKHLEKSREIDIVSSYLMALSAWDIFFSPFGSDRRFSIPLFLIAILRTECRQADESRQ